MSTRQGCTAVMATGVVSLDLASAGRPLPSHLLLVLAGAAWLALLVRGELARGFAGVAATAVVGDGLAHVGWTVAAWPLLVAAGALWLAQLPRLTLRRRAAGAVFLPAVATQSLAVLSATLAAGRLRIAGLALLGGGLLWYARVLPRFDRRELRRGRGDQWVAGGALAISALASAGLGAPEPVSIVLWAAAIAWLPLLLAGELACLRRGDPAIRWSTVFPLGMYAAMSFAVGALAGAAWMRDFARACTWVALAAWTLAALDAARCLPADNPPSRRSGS